MAAITLRMAVISMAFRAMVLENKLVPPKSKPAAWTLNRPLFFCVMGIFEYVDVIRALL